jgi:hypothetical protein
MKMAMGVEQDFLPQERVFLNGCTAQYGRFLAFCFQNIALNLALG